MATQVQIRRGSTSEHNTFTGATGEITVDTDKDTLVVHDGTTQGGHPLAQEDLSNVPSSASPTFNGTNLTNIEAFPVGTKMVFNQTSAPTGWTKSTAQNDKALRVVSGSVGTGGTHGLSSPPSTSHTHTGPSHTHSTPSHSHSHTISAGAHTLTTAEMPAHTHLNGVADDSNVPFISPTTSGISGSGGLWQGPGESRSYQGNTSSTGGGGSHSHSLSGSITSGGSGTSGIGGTGNTGSNGPTAFAPAYVDVIIATKS